MDLQAQFNQPRDLEAGLSLPEHPDVSPVRLILAAYPLAEWCRASTDYFAKPEEIWIVVLSQACHRKNLFQRWCCIFVLYRGSRLIKDIQTFPCTRDANKREFQKTEEASTDSPVYAYTRMRYRHSSVRSGAWFQNEPTDTNVQESTQALGAHTYDFVN